MKSIHICIYAVLYAKIGNKKNIYNGSTSQYLNLFPPIAADIFDNLWFIFDQMKWIITIAFVFPGTYYYIDFYFTISIKTKQLRFSTIT